MLDHMLVLAQSNSNGAGAFGLMFTVLWLAAAVATVAGFWKVFEKAGQPGWASLVPVYNFYVITTKIAQKPWFWCLSLLAVFIPFVGALAFLGVWTYMNIEVAKRFGKTPLFGVGMGLLSFVFYPMLGFGPAALVTSSSAQNAAFPKTSRQAA